jgi:hypothetical protein
VSADDDDAFRDFAADNWEDLFNAAIATQDANDATDSDVTEAEFDWGTKPVGLLLWSDWHVGSRWTDLRRLREDIEDVWEFRESYPGALHLAHLGDITDNYFPASAHPSGMAEAVIARTDKQRMVALGLAKLAGPFDEMLYGCHLAWSLTQAGEDVLAPMANQLGAVNGGYGLNSVYQVGDQSYTHVLRHKTLSMSGSAPGNAQRRIDREYGPFGERADVISVSHLHTCHLEAYELAGRHVVFTRSGGYKGGDCFARAGSFTHTKTADCGVPLLIFLPHEHRVIPFDGHSWREGLMTLAALRENHRGALPELEAVAA